MTTKLHITDVRTYKSCRRLWDFTSHLRMNLEPETTPEHFILGRAVHYGLASYYESHEDPTVAFQRFCDASASASASASAMQESAIKLGKGMLAHYVSWVNSTGIDKEWETVATEMKFGVPVPALADTDGTDSDFSLDGRLDMVVRNTRSGKLWVREFKTATWTVKPDSLVYDDQNLGYSWAASQILGEPIAGVNYRFLYKKVPDAPGVLRDGSLSKSVKGTTYFKYIEALRERAGASERMFNQLQAEYADVLSKLIDAGASDYFLDTKVIRTKKEMEGVPIELYHIGKEMTDPNTVMYPSPDWLKCSWCAFKEPCRNMGMGIDNSVLLKHCFKRREQEIDIVALSE